MFLTLTLFLTLRMRHGFLLIDKPAGFTSHDAVAVVRKRLSERSVGHLGTLDPAATGLLVLAVGKKALKVVQLYSELHKEYEATVLFGKVSTTYDGEGIIKHFDIAMGWTPPDESKLQNVIADRFVGKIKQVPPAHSAVHVAGERAYNMARAGREVIIPPRIVQIDSCKILSYTYPHLTLKVACGSGTYIRSLANDLGDVLRCGGYLETLRRTKVGEWTVENAVKPDAATWTDVLPLKDVLKGRPSRELTDSDWEEIGHGRNIDAEVEPDTIAWHEGLPVAILVPAPDGTAHARKVF